MATLEPTTVATVNVTDLDDDLMQLWMSKLSLEEQTVATHVCKRFNDAAYKLTTVMWANEPTGYMRYSLIPRMPKLKKICWFGLMVIDDITLYGGAKTSTFLDSLAKINPNIELLVGIPYFPGLKYSFLSRCKEYHADYDGTKFKGLLLESGYESLYKKYPDVKVRYSMDLPSYSSSEKSMEERLSDPNLSALFTSFQSVNDIRNIVTMAKHLTVLVLDVPVTSKPDYSFIFNSIVRLPLKKFDFRVDEILGQVFSWSEFDIDSFKNLLQVKSLVDVSLDMPMEHQTYLITLKCFLDCPRNNFHHFSSRSGYDRDVSPFYPTCYSDNRSQFDPSMSMNFQEDVTSENFPIARFIPKFSPKHREFMFESRFAMLKMVESCHDLIKNQPKIHFVFYGPNGSSFRPIQLEEFLAEHTLRQ